MVKKYLFKMILAAGFLALFSIKYVDVTIGERIKEYPLTTAWKAIGLPLKEVSTQSWLELDKHWKSIYELKNIAEMIKNKLNITLKSSPTFGEQDGVTYASFEGLLKEDHTTIVTVTIQSSSGLVGNDTQMGITTSLCDLNKDLGSYVESLRRKANSFGKEPHFRVLLTGERNGRLRPEVIREFSSRAFQKVKAELINSAYEAGNSYQKGYTNLLQETVLYDAHPMNIEIGTRYDSGINMTQIVLASPSLGDGS